MLYLHHKSFLNEKKSDREKEHRRRTGTLKMLKSSNDSLIAMTEEHSHVDVDRSS